MAGLVCNLVTINLYADKYLPCDDAAVWFMRHIAVHYRRFKIWGVQ